MTLGFWAAMAPKPPKPLKKRDRVVNTVPLRDVPEGTGGRVRLINGLGPWIRMWVQFDNGIWLGSIPRDKLVREADWPAFQQRRAEEAERKAREPEKKAVMAAGPTADAGPAPQPTAEAAASKVPAHLLERAKQARERKAAAAAGGDS